MNNQPVLPDDPLGLKRPAAAGPGHNLPPAFDQAKYDELVDRVDQFLAASDVWIPVEIKTDEKAALLNDQISGLRTLYKSVEAQRVAEKKPHDNQGQRVQDAFIPQLTRIETASKKLNPKLDAFALEKQRKLDEEAARQRQVAAQKEAEAKRVAEESAKSQSIDDQIEAEDAAKEAAEATKQAAKATKQKAHIGSATGAGRAHVVRKVKTAEITNIRQLFLHFQNDPKVVDLLQSLANAEVRRADFNGTPPPGTNLVVK